MLVIRQRIDKWGVAEVDVRKLGTDSIQISLPGQQDPEQAKELIGTTAQLEFRMVDDTSTVLQRATSRPTRRRRTRASRLDRLRGLSAQLEGKDREALLAYVKGKAPDGPRRCCSSACEQTGRRATATATARTWSSKTVPLTGESLAGADASRSQTDERPRGELLLRRAGRHASSAT